MGTMSDRPYSRIYHELAEEYPEIYDGPLLADYVRLLISADQAHPTRARWAGFVSKRSLSRLQQCGLIVVDGSRYSVKGMDKERAIRAEKARKAALASHAPGSARSSATSSARTESPSLPSRAEPRRAEPSRADDGPATAFDAYMECTGWPARDGGLTFLREIVEGWGHERTATTMRRLWLEDPDKKTILGRVKTVLLNEDDAAKERNRRSELEYQRDMQRARDSMTPEAKARADEMLARAGAAVKGMPA